MELQELKKQLEEIKNPQTNSPQIIKSFCNVLRELEGEDLNVVVRLIFSSKSDAVILGVLNVLESIINNSCLEDKKKIMSYILRSHHDEAIQRLVLKYLRTHPEEVKDFIEIILKSRSKLAIQFIREDLWSLSEDDFDIIKSHLFASHAPGEIFQPLIPRIKLMLDNMSPQNLKNTLAMILSSQVSELINSIHPYCQKIEGILTSEEKKKYISKIISFKTSTENFNHYTARLLNSLSLDDQLKCIPHLIKDTQRNGILRVALSEIVSKNIENAGKNGILILDEPIQNKIEDLAKFIKERSRHLSKQFISDQLTQLTQEVSNQEVSNIQQDKIINQDKNTQLLTTSINIGFAFFNKEPSESNTKSRNRLLNKDDVKTTIYDKRNDSCLEASSYEPKIQKKPLKEPSIDSFTGKLRAGFDLISPKI